MANDRPPKIPRSLHPTMELDSKSPSRQNKRRMVVCSRPKRHPNPRRRQRRQLENKLPQRKNMPRITPQKPRIIFFNNQGVPVNRKCYKTLIRVLLNALSIYRRLFRGSVALGPLSQPERLLKICSRWSQTLQGGCLRHLSIA